MDALKVYSDKYAYMLTFIIGSALVYTTRWAAGAWHGIVHACTVLRPSSGAGSLLTLTLTVACSLLTLTLTVACSLFERIA